MSVPPTEGVPFDLALYRRLCETAPDAIVVIDPDGRVIFMSMQGEQMFGYSADEIVGQPIEMLVPERLRAGHRAHRQRYLQQPTARPMGMDMTLIAVSKTQREFPVEISLSPVEVAGRRFVSAAIRDVSRLQSARAAMSRAHYQAHVAELGQQVIGARELDEVAGAVPGLTASALKADAVLFYVLDAHDNTFTCRGAYGLSAGAADPVRIPNDPSEGLGYVLVAADAVVVSECAAHSPFDARKLAPALGLQSALAVPIVGTDGPLGVLVAAFRQRRQFSEDDKNFLRSVASIVASAMKYSQVEERLRHAQQLEAIGQLTGGIAHDFNNLLTVIIGNLQLVQEDAEGNETLAPSVDAALRAASSAADLTRKLLAFSRRQALRPRPIDVNELVGGMLDMIRRTIGERITILAFPDPDVPRAHADPGQLETALLNLVVNARDAMPGGGRLSIETAVRQLDPEYVAQVGDVVPGEYVMIAVTDTGIGMPESVVKRAFDPYFTTKERGKGSGLGLSMVHGFVKQSRGHVAIYSESGRGTTVRLFLPIARSEGAAAAASAGSTSMPRGREAILMVEDEDAVRAVGSRFLTQLGYQVHAAADGDAALDLLAAHPDIRMLFTDIVLPGRFGGLELAREVRLRRPDLALLFTSGYASGAIAGVEKLPGAMIDKPYHREALARAVRAALDGAN